MSTISEQITSLKEAIIALEEDATKTDNGNKAAGTRVRKSLQEVVNQCKETRKAVLQARNSDS